MGSIKIESNIPAEKINHILSKSTLEKHIDIQCEEHEDRIRYIFPMNNINENKKGTLLKNLAKIVNEIIIKHYIDDMIYYHIDETVGQMDSSKRLEILEDVKSVLISKNLFTEEKEEMQNEIIDYLMENNTLIIDGYLNFRLKSIHSVIKQAIELVLGNFQVDVDYEEFIDMLKTLVISQESEIDLINIVLEDDRYNTMNSDFEKIDNEEMNKMLDDLSLQGVHDIDLILSTVITLNPKKVIVHLGDKEKDELTSILEEIFEDRLEVCRDCELCNK